MKISFENFGPIASGSLELKPLTILIGPNQVGKSFAAMAAHAFLRAQSDFAYSAFEWYMPHRFYQRSYKQHPAQKATYMDAVAKLQKELQNTKPNIFVSYSESKLQALEDLTRVGVIKQAIRSSFEEVFAASAETLLRHGNSQGSVSVENGEWRITLSLHSSNVETSFDLKHKGSVYFGYRDKRRKTPPPPTDGTLIEFRPSDQQKHKNERQFVEDLASRLRRLVRIPRFDSSPSFYVPAIRSGLLLSHRLFLSLLVRNVQRVGGFEPLSVPQMTGVTADFLQSLLRLQDFPRDQANGKELSRIARTFEKLMTGGKVFFEENDESVASIKYRTAEGFELPLNLVSSTVTELAPIFLRLQQGVPPQTVLIIEEPESHLSPSNQAKMAEFLASIVQSKIRVIITTHSTFLLEQLNNLIVRGARKMKSRSSEVALKAEDVAAHHIMLRANESGSEIFPLSVDPREGIDMTEFVRVYEQIYEEGFEIKSELEHSTD